MTELDRMDEAELTAYALDHRALADSASAELRRRRLVQRTRVAAFILEHREEFLEFFALGGCKRPEEAVDALTNYPEAYRPMAYAHKDEL